MSIETGVYTLLTTSTELAAAAGVPLAQLPGLVLRSGAVVDPPDRWIAVRWEEAASQGWLVMPMFTLRAHDRDQSYDWITSVLDAAKARLTAVVHQQGITQVDWTGRSPDLADDGYRTLTKYDTYRVAAGQTTGRK